MSTAAVTTAAPAVAFARNTDPSTSHDAAAKVKVNELEQKFIDALATGSPTAMTADAVSVATGEPLNTISPRTRPLVTKGLIVDTGAKFKTRTGTPAIAWALTEKGWRQATPATN